MILCSPAKHLQSTTRCQMLWIQGEAHMSLLATVWRFWVFKKYSHLVHKAIDIRHAFLSPLTWSWRASCLLVSSLMETWAPWWRKACSLVALYLFLWTFTFFPHVEMADHCITQFVQCVVGTQFLQNTAFVKGGMGQLVLLLVTFPVCGPSQSKQRCFFTAKLLKPLQLSLSNQSVGVG